MLRPSLVLKATCERIPSAFSAAAGTWSILSVQDLRVGHLCWPEEAALRIAVSSSASEPSLQEHPHGCCVHVPGLPGAGASLSFSSLELETPAAGFSRLLGSQLPEEPQTLNTIFPCQHSVSSAQDLPLCSSSAALGQCGRQNITCPAASCFGALTRSASPVPAAGHWRWCLCSGMDAVPFVGWCVLHAAAMS